MKSRSIGIILLGVSILFILNFSLLNGISNIFNAAASAIAGGIPQKLPVIQAGPDGSASTQVEIEVPPGTKGVIPELSLSYNSNGGNGVVGMGWSLNGIPTIFRNPSNGIGYNGSDSYISSLAGELVDISGNKTIYHSKKESYIKFEPQGTCGDGPCTWIATDKDGRRHIFGSSIDSRIPALGRTAGSIREWALSREEDSFGNGYDVSYTLIDVTNGDYYPSTITYNDRTIRFNYENRNDKIPNYSLGTLERLQRRLNTIDILVGGNTFRTYDLDYTTGPVTGRSVLQKIKRSGSNTFGSENFADLNFTYTNHSGNFSPGNIDYQTLNNTISMAVFMPNIALDILNVYFNGGLPYHPSALDSNVDASLQYVVKVPVPDRNACNLGFASCLCAALPVCWGGNMGFFDYLAGNCLSFLSWGGPGACDNGVDSALTAWLPMDLNGDGITDFATLNGNETNGSIHLVGHIQRIGQGPVTFNGPNIPIHYNTFYQPVDLNGDGKTDFVYEDGGTLWGVYSTGGNFSSPVAFGNVSLVGANRDMKTFSPYEYRFQYSPSNTTPLASNRSVADFFADMNGDDLTDFVHSNGGSFSIYINRKTYFDNPIVIGGGSDFYINSMIDFTGDGKADYVQLLATYDNSTLTALQAQKAALDTLMAQYQVDHARVKAVADQLPTPTTHATINDTEFQNLLDYLTLNGYDMVSDSLETDGKDYAYDPAQVASLQTVLDNIVSAKMNFVGQQSQAINIQIGAIYAQGTMGQATYALQVRTFNTSNGTSQVRTFPISNSIDPDKSTLADINRDGALDFVSFIGTQVSVSLFMGNGFAPPVYTGLNAGNGKNLVQFNFGEVNGDGLSDLVLLNRESHVIETYLSRGDGSFTLSGGYSFGGFSTQEYTDSNGIERSDLYQISLQDINLDGISDVSIAFLSSDKNVGKIYYRYNAARNSGEDMLLSTSNGAGQSSSVQYALKNTHAGAVNVGSGNYPDMPNLSPGYLATQTTQGLSAGISKTTTYRYTNARQYLGTRNVSRSLGFASVRETDINTGFYSITDFFQNDYRLAGTPQSTRSYNASNNLTGSTANSGFSFPNSFGTEMAVPGTVTTNDYSNGTLTETSIKNYTYDAYGFVTSEIESLGSHTITNTTQVSNDVAGWRMGRVLRSRKNVDGTWVEDVSLGYTGDNLTSQTQFPASASPLTTTFGYDSLGNVISVTEPSGGVSLISYDAGLNLFPVTKTNALGHVTTTAYDLATGLETSTTDANGAITLTGYDGYGRKTSVTYPGEGSPNETYTYTNTGEYDLSNLNNNEFVTKTIRDNVSGNTSTTRVFTDPLGNTIRTEGNTALAGINTIEESFYDYTKGQLIRTSNEYYTSIAPQYTTYQYNDPDGELTSITEPSPGGGVITTNVTRTAFTETKTTTYPDGQSKTEVVTKNELGQTMSKTENGRTLSYTYSPFGGISSVTDVGGLTTSFVYDSKGRRTSTQDPNSGTINYSYNSLGQLSSQTDARGKTISFSYDILGRILAQNTNGPEAPVSYTYDDASVPYSKGRVTQIADGSGITKLFYNQRGETIQKTRYVDDITAIFKRDYDSLGRPITETLPDGTKLHNFYSPNGTLSSITMDSADGTSTGHTVVSYQGPYLNANGVPSVRRVTGNGVTMEIGFEPLDKKPLSVVSKKPDGSVIGNTELTYDSKGNITKIEDKLNPNRTQNFTLDSLGRVTQATGKYGTQDYSYSPNGNLLQKGAYTLGYTDGSHANAVTTATSANTGTLSYGYDASGNMVSRNGDTLRYDSYGKLIELTPYATSSSIRNTYDFQGNRVKTVSDISLISTYTLEENYEIVRTPGVAERHTLYVRGLQGDLVAQWTRDDATLRIADTGPRTEEIASENSIGSVVGRFVGTTTKPFCKDVAIDCGTYYKNRIRNGFIFKFFQNGVSTSTYNAFYFLLLLGLCYLVYPYFLKGNELLQRLSWRGVGTPVLILAMFVVTSLPGCGVLPGTGGKDGDPPWILAMGANVAPGTPNIQNPGVGMTGGGSVGGFPVTGMYFFHPDHLGSIQMITDGAGNPASGPEPGTSYVSYEPYGSIIRNDSYGPDIFRYKFTGQIEDKDTGLYYYKARYYEPILGRFLQADSVVMPTNVNGMNRYMYVDGNPVSYRDPSGHVSGSGLMHMVNRIIGHAMGKDFGSNGLDKKLSTGGAMKGIGKATFLSKGRFYWDVGNTIFSQRRIGRWWVEYSGKSHVQNTANFGIHMAVTSFTSSQQCKDQFGAATCQSLEILNEMIYQKYERHYTDWENPFKGGITLSLGDISKPFENNSINCKSQQSLSTGFFLGAASAGEEGRPNGDGSINRGEKEAELFKTIFIILTTCVATQNSE
ncbi:RHS repeat-associated core domain protein [Leptospira weilii serovar Ranarum str. ICFT]|uniref:RHS repeat-associated core domain protein n=1 Tax=Leptospira weilii serovar Ranarum str. ICFT TaxID=1218598 RepID=N1WHP2_9LEPT|nr:RHS repeat-associated core domain-containing protein [Leptospira weilii]EMY76847.1 RHS repeat-associated core domain protein [Leptospira weilii serovar Ranarum str. ICFT]